MKSTCIYISYPMGLTSITGSCRLLCYRTRKKSGDYLLLARDRKDIVVIIIILLSLGIYMNDNWRPDETVLWIWNSAWLGNQARL
jgi:hypothetical protein